MIIIKIWRKKKEKNTTEQGKKKRKDQKKSKNEKKDEEQQQRNKVKEPTLQTSEETDDEREESEQELLVALSQPVETSSKARKRNKNKTQPTKESNVKDEKTRVPPVTYPKSTSKDEPEPTKQQTKVQVKSSQITSKPTLPTTTSSTTKKPTPPPVYKEQEQPFTVVGANRHKAGTPPLQQQQQNKSQVNTTSSAAPVQQTSSVPVQHEQLAPRQQPPQKETPAQLSSLPPNPLPLKQQPQQPQPPKVLPKVADLIKVLPSSQAVVTELMTALDAFPLSTDELDIIMHKIANKQSVVKQDWTKLQQGQKVDPQAHIGQVMDESAKAYADDVRNNSMKRIKELTDELNIEKRRNNDLLKDKTDKDREIQILHAQLDSVQHKQEPTQIPPQQHQKLQTLELQLKRITEENIHLNHQLTQLTTTNLMNAEESSNMKVHVLSEQIKKLSVDNANLEKKVHSNELLAKEAQKEKEDLIRYNEQLTQSLQNAEKDLKHIEEKHHKKVDEHRTAHLNEINEYKRRIKELETDNEQLRREEIVHVEPNSTNDIQTITINTEEHEKFEKEINELKQTIEFYQQKEREYNESKQKLDEEYKKKFDDLQTQYQSQENEIERLKQEKHHEQQQADESRNNEINALRTELDQLKSTLSQSDDRLRYEREKQRYFLTELLSEDVRSQLPHDNQDFDQWISSYGQLFESSKRTLYEESAGLKSENDKLRKNMTDIENHLKEIESTVQSKEETLFNELKSKDAAIENVRSENDRLNDELQHLRNEYQHLQSAHNASVNETRALKLQLDERFLVGTNTPSVVADESFELVKQPSPSLSPIVIDIRAEQFNDLIRSSKEGLEHQDSSTQQHHNETGETSTSNVDESTASSSSNNQS